MDSALRPLGHGHDDRVHEAEVEIAVLTNQFVRAIQIRVGAPIDAVQTPRQVRHEHPFRSVAEVLRYQVIHIRQYCPGEQPPHRVLTEKIKKRFVVAVIFVDERDDDTGIGNTQRPIPSKSSSALSLR